MCAALSSTTSSLAPEFYSNICQFSSLILICFRACLFLMFAFFLADGNLHKGAHHLDLMFSTPDDPEQLQEVKDS